MENPKKMKNQKWKLEQKKLKINKKMKNPKKNEESKNNEKIEWRIETKSKKNEKSKQKNRMKNRNKIEKSKQKNPKKMKNRKNPKIKLKIEKKENILRFEKKSHYPGYHGESHDHHLPGRYFYRWCNKYFYRQWVLQNQINWNNRTFGKLFSFNKSCPLIILSKINCCIVSFDKMETNKQTFEINFSDAFHWRQKNNPLPIFLSILAIGSNGI